MFNKALLNTEVQQFIRNFDGSTPDLVLAGSPFKNVLAQELAQQIESRRKAKDKLPKWHATENILFPPKLNIEQASSEITAIYKASLIGGKTLADITGGFGVDSFFLSENFSKTYHYETNVALSEIARHNFKIFGKHNVHCMAKDGMGAILNNRHDAVFADPSRRHKSKGKVFFLKDCEPDIPQNISEILGHCETFLLKTSPMLDISIGLGELKNVAEIHIVAVENEVKELLWLMKNNGVRPLKIKAINFTKTEHEIFGFDFAESANATFALPKKYLFEPNAAILKSGAFDLVSEKLKVCKLHKNTHLYTSDILAVFPGRRFLINKAVPYSKAAIRSAINFKKANIAIRNFPESVETLRKKWKIADGGDIYLFFVTNMEGKKEMLVCSKM